MFTLIPASDSTRIFHLKHVLRHVEGKKTLFKIMNLLITKCIYEKFFTGFIVYAGYVFVFCYTEFSFLQEHDVIKEVCLSPQFYAIRRGGAVLCCSSKHTVAGREIPFCQVHCWMGLGVSPYRTESESGLAG